MLRNYAMLSSMNSGASNGNWKGGRVIASNGYILLRVGSDHHLADVRGYAYEHRVIAEKSLGRRLIPGEQVHHLDNIKGNNAPSNLCVTGSMAEHRALHRIHERGLRMPGEQNPTVACWCGCGKEIKYYDRSGRPRRYVSGHNPQPAPTEKKILAILSIPLHRAVIASRTGMAVRSVATALSKLKSRGLVSQVSRGIWHKRKEVAYVRQNNHRLD